MENAPFQRGDMVMKKGLFGRKTRIVNRIWPICGGWEMFVDSFQWNGESGMLRWCKVTNTRGWYKI